MPTENDLQDILGFNHNDIIVYHFLLSHPASTVIDVSRETSITRTNCYYILNKLLKLNLIRENEQKRRKFFANNPDILKIILQKKQQRLTEIVSELQIIYKDSLIKSNGIFKEFGDLRLISSSALKILISPKHITHLIPLEIIKLFETYNTIQLDDPDNQEVVIIWDKGITTYDPISNTSSYSDNNAIKNTYLKLFQIVSRETI